MSLPLKLLVIFVVSACVVTGQALLTLVARRLAWPATVANVLESTVLSGLFYACVTVYLLGLVSYAVLLRFFPFAQVNVTLTVFIIGLTMAYTYALGQHLSAMQWAGAALCTVGVIALNSDT